jgi:hypothetical protein
MYLPILTLLLMPDVDTDEFDRLERTAPLVEFVEISDSLNLEPEIVPVLIDERDEQVVKESLGKDGVFRIVTQTNTKVYRLELESFPMKTPSNTKQKELL